jgi:hypothetical protein
MEEETSCRHHFICAPSWMAPWRPYAASAVSGAASPSVSSTPCGRMTFPPPGANPFSPPQAPPNREVRA